MWPTVLSHPTVSLSALVQVVKHDVVDQGVRVNPPEEVQVGEQSKIHFMVHPWDYVRKATDSV